MVSGALLAKEGYKVTVLEKNAIIGGGLQTFKRHGVGFPTGMHVFGGFGKDGNLRKMYEYLGVMDRIKICPSDADAVDVITVIESGETYRLPKGREAFVKYLSERFPDEAQHIQTYIDKLYKISEEEHLYYLRESSDQDLMHSEDFLCSMEQLMTKCGLQNPKLKVLLGYLVPLIGSSPETTPAFIPAVLSLHHINGHYQFVDDSQQLAEALKEVIENAGGQVLANTEVVHIKVENRQVVEVVSKKGDQYQADCYISDVHPDVLLRLLDDGAFPRFYKERLQSIPETHSSFKVFIKFKEGAFPYYNHANFLLTDYDANILEQKSSSQKDWPRGLLFTTPPVEGQGDFAQTMVIVTPMSYDWVRPWENTHTGHRGKEYENWKQTMMNQVLDYMENLYPDFRKSIEFTFASSPLTIRDYYGNKEGSNYGFQKDSRNLMLSQMSVFTKVKNLYLTGQNVNLHGLCGVSLTAIETVEALVGKNAIVRKINNFCMNHS